MTAMATATMARGASSPPPVGVRGWYCALRDVLVHPRTLFVLLAFALRLTWILAVPSRPVGDFAVYRESAAYLLEHRHLDPEFIYMPGYVLMLAAVQALGGGLLAQKMIGVVAGTLLVAGCAGIADRLFGRRAGITAAAMMAVWPAGIAVSSVTGTDVPAGALVATGIFVLIGDVPRPAQGNWGRVVAAGIIMGLAAWVRAVAVPLIGVSLLVWRARGFRWRHAVARALLAMAVAAVVLAPWGLRNLRVYGQAFLTDSHGGHTALVGSNPNSEGTYSRSLNVLFTRATGFRLFDVPARHRDADAAAYTLAKQWAASEPAYAVGLMAAKADRLLTHERNLLYWPVYRAGVLDSGLAGIPGPGDAQRAWFDRHRAVVEALCDGFWWAVSGLFVVGMVLAFLRLQRQAAWLALAVAAFPGVLVGIYTVFFSEVRYHLAIAPLLFPGAAFAATWLFLRGRDRFRGDGRALAIAAVALVVVLLGYTTARMTGTRLRARHRWAVTVCHLPDARQPQLCAWRRRPRPGVGDSPVRGVWDGVGVRLAASRGGAGTDLWGSVETDLSLPAGRYHVHAALALTHPRTSVDDAGVDPPSPALPSVALRVGATVFARALFTSPSGSRRSRADDDTAVIEGVFDHPGGALALDVEVESPGSGSIFDGKTLWISDLSVERFPGLEIIAPQ
jgi:4-amino-4-deoxy-L-arabinose transferase-like glycosyltransferase